MAAYLKAPTILYHASLAPEGKLFQGSAERPLPHPGEGWQDNRAGFPEAAGGKPATVSADTLVSLQGELVEAKDKIERLTEEKADAIARAEAAEAALSGDADKLSAEKADHARTRAELEAARADVRVQHDRIAGLEAEAQKVPGLTEQLAAAQRTIADLNNQLAAKSKPAKAA